MNRYAFFLTVLLGLTAGTISAEEANIQDQIIEFKNKIEELEKSNEKLRMEISNKDEEVIKIKQQLQELEEKIKNNQ